MPSIERISSRANSLNKDSSSKKKSEEINALNKRISALGSDVEQARTQLRTTTDKLEAAHKQLSNREAEVQTLTKRVRNLEEEYEQNESRLQAANEKLDLAIKTVDESERGRKVLENRNVTDEDRIIQLQKELEATVLLGEETDRKFEETSRQLATTEVDLERGDARLEGAETKILDLEEELKVVGSHLKTLTISEQEAVQRGIIYEEQISSLTFSLKDAENRAEEYEKLRVKLQKEVDRLEDAVTTEKDKCKMINTDLDTAFSEITGF